MSGSQDEFHYQAFISYSHRDKRWGDWLHRALETYRVPKRLVGQSGRDGVIPPRVMPVFRDREELPTSSDLGSVINDALLKSRMLIVVCSPRSAKSHWVNEEIIAYKKLGRADRILCLIVDGEPNATDKPELPTSESQQECFPPALRFDVDADGQLTDQRSEPIAADARATGDGKRNALLKLIAGLLGVGFDDLKQRDLQRRQKRLMTVTAVSLTLLAVTVGLAVAALLARNDAIVARIEADGERQRAELSESDSRRMVSHAFGDLGWRRVDNFDQAGAMLLHVESLKRLIQTPVPRKEDDHLSRLAALRVAGHLRWAGRCEAMCLTDGTIHAVHESKGRVLAAAVPFYADIDSPHPLLIYDVSAGKQVATSEEKFHGHVFDAAFSPTGHRLAIAARHLTIWDTMTGALLIDHDATVPTRLAFTPDGEKVICINSKRVFAIDLVTKKEVWSSDAIQELNHLAVSPDGQHLFVAGIKNEAMFMTVADGKAASPKLIPDVAIERIDSLDINGVHESSFSADGKRMLASSSHGRLNVWSVPDGKPLFGPIDLGSSALSAKISPSGRYLVAARLRELWRWDIENVLAQPRKVEFSTLIHELEFINDGQSLAVNGYDETQILDVEQLASRTLPPASFSPVSTMTALPGDRLAIHSGNEIQVWNFAGARQAWTIIDDQSTRPVVPNSTNPRGLATFQRTSYTRPPESPPLRVAWHPSSDAVYIVGNDGRMATWSRQENGGWKKGSVLDSKIGAMPLAFDMLSDQRLFISSPTLHVITNMRAEVTSRPMPVENGVVRLRTGGDRMLIIGNDLWLRDLNTNKAVADAMFQPSGQWKDAIDGWLSSDGEFLLTAHHEIFLSTSGPLTLTGWNARNGEKLWETTGSNTLAYAAITLAPDGKSFAMTANGQVMVHNASDGKQRGETVNLNCSGLRYSPDSRSLAVLTLDGVAVIDVQTGKQILPAFNRGRDNVVDAAFDHAGDLVATTTTNQATVWDARNGKRLSNNLRSGAANGVSISPDGRSMISIGPRSVLWDLWDPDLLPSDIESLRQAMGQLQARAELHANRRINDAGAEVKLKSEERLKRWEKIKATGN